MIDTKPTTVSVPEADLISWHHMLAEAENPSVTFDHDHSKMMDSAYEARGDAIRILKEKIAEFIPF